MISLIKSNEKKFRTMKPVPTACVSLKITKYTIDIKT